MKVKVLSVITVFMFKTCCFGFDPCSKQFEIITDFKYDECPNGFFYTKTGNPIFNCFSQCFADYPIDIIQCDPNPCPPGFKCEALNPPNRNTFCQLDGDSCLKYFANDPSVINPYLSSWWKPTCLPDGTWAPKQCKGEQTNGRCFCFDAVGKRIFGQAFIQDAANMTCACSRRRAEILSEGKRFYTTLHCDSMGNYESLQCDDGQCWCAEPQNGEVIGKVVPEKMMTILPCYSKENVTERYMRQCESDEYAQAKVKYELGIHGTQHVNFPHVLCDADGTYGHYQISSGMAYCKWRDNTVIGSYASSVDQNLYKLNCNCARDTKLYESLGLKQNLLCLSTGNYKPQQQASDGSWYCVDDDGFRKSPYLTVLPLDDQCATYT